MVFSEDLFFFCAIVFSFLRNVEEGLIKVMGVVSEDSIKVIVAAACTITFLEFSATTPITLI